MKRPAVVRNRSWDTWLVKPVLCHWATTTEQPPALIIFYRLHRLCWSASVSHPAATRYNGRWNPLVCCHCANINERCQGTGDVTSHWPPGTVHVREFEGECLVPVIPIPYHSNKVDDNFRRSVLVCIQWRLYKKFVLRQGDKIIPVILTFFILSLRHVYHNAWKDDNYAPHNLHSQLAAALILFKYRLSEIHLFLLTVIILATVGGTFYLRKFMRSGSQV